MHARVHEQISRITKSIITTLVHIGRNAVRWNRMAQGQGAQCDGRGLTFAIWDFATSHQQLVIGTKARRHQSWSVAPRFVVRVQHICVVAKLRTWAFEHSRTVKLNEYSNGKGNSCKSKVCSTFRYRRLGNFGLATTGLVKMLGMGLFFSILFTYYY